MRNRTTPLFAGMLCGALLSAVATPGLASDHADPIDLTNRKPLEGGITDLFFFPDGENMVVILCVRRALRGVPERVDADGKVQGAAAGGASAPKNAPMLELMPYTYSIFMDLRSTVLHWDGEFPPQPPDDASDTAKSRYAEELAAARELQEYQYRYGGKVERPADIKPTVTISFRLNNDGTLAEEGVTIDGQDLSSKTAHSWNGAVQEPPQIDPNEINVWTGVADDPFIFPPFFGTNVVAMVASIPKSFFPNRQDWILWAVSTEDGEQVDHVGRSLRTQNPRFELLNTLPPSGHAAAVLHEHENPSLMRDLFRRLGFNQEFAYRTWDQEAPDVMLFTRTEGLDFGLRTPDGQPILSRGGGADFPNGRKLTDDVAKRLAEYGDTLLYELSYQSGRWPRATANDRPFQSVFPYLGNPHPAPDNPPEPFMISTANKLKLLAIVVTVVLVWLLTAWVLALLLDRRRQRRRFL
jgi:hypothetical protein